MLVSTVVVSCGASLLYGGPLTTNAAGTQSSPNSALRYHTHLLRAIWGRLLPASGLGPGSGRIRKTNAEHLLSSLCVSDDSIHCYWSRKWWWWESVAAISAEAKMEVDPQSTPQRSPSCVHSGHVTYGIPEHLIVTGLCVEVTFSFDAGCIFCVLQYRPRALAGDLAHSRCSLNWFLMKKWSPCSYFLADQVT